MANEILPKSCDKIVNEAFLNDDIATIDKYFNTIPLPRYDYYIDTAFEEGKEKVAKFLLEKGIRPSLYSKQIGEINGHKDLVKFFEKNYKLRNYIDIRAVHCHIDRTKRIPN